MNSKELGKLLNEKGLKVTIQRLAVYEALYKERVHPTAEHLTSIVCKKYPTISAGTVYKTLDTFVEHNLIKRVKSDRDVMRYDATMERHHHLYSLENDQISDYYDEELDKIIESYFKKKDIPDFKLEDFKLQLTGKFIN